MVNVDIDAREAGGGAGPTIGSAARAVARSSGMASSYTTSSLVQEPFAFAVSIAARPASVITPARSRFRPAVG